MESGAEMKNGDKASKKTKAVLLALRRADVFDNTSIKWQRSREQHNYIMDLRHGDISE